MVWKVLHDRKACYRGAHVCIYHKKKFFTPLCLFVVVFFIETLLLKPCSGVHVIYITQEWGAAGDIDNLNLTWHVPSLEELELTDRLLHTFLTPEIQRLRAFMEGQNMDRFVGFVIMYVAYISALLRGLS